MGTPTPSDSPTALDWSLGRYERIAEQLLPAARVVAAELTIQLAAQAIQGVEARSATRAGLREARYALPVGRTGWTAGRGARTAPRPGRGARPGSAGRA